MVETIHTNTSPHPIVLYRECVKKHHKNSSLDVVGCRSFQPKPNPSDPHCNICGCGRRHHRQVVVAPGATFNIPGMAPPPPPMNPPPEIGTMSGSAYRNLVISERAKMNINPPLRYGDYFPHSAATDAREGFSADPNGVPLPPKKKKGMESNAELHK